MLAFLYRINDLFLEKDAFFPIGINLDANLGLSYLASQYMVYDGLPFNGDSLNWHFVPAFGCK